MDSLMGVEIKQTLERDFDVILSANEIRQLTIKQLKGISHNEGTSESLPKEDSKKETISKVSR